MPPLSHFMLCFVEHLILGDLRFATFASRHLRFAMSQMILKKVPAPRKSQIYIRVGISNAAAAKIQVRKCMKMSTGTGGGLFIPLFFHCGRFGAISGMVDHDSDAAAAAKDNNCAPKVIETATEENSEKIGTEDDAESPRLTKSASGTMGKPPYSEMQRLAKEKGNNVDEQVGEDDEDTENEISKQNEEDTSEKEDAFIDFRWNFYDLGRLERFHVLGVPHDAFWPCYSRVIWQKNPLGESLLRKPGIDAQVQVKRSRNVATQIDNYGSLLEREKRKITASSKEVAVYKNRSSDVDLKLCDQDWFENVKYEAKATIKVSIVERWVTTTYAVPTLIRKYSFLTT